MLLLQPLLLLLLLLQLLQLLLPRLFLANIISRFRPPCPVAPPSLAMTPLPFSN
jgi:hypothetical protein